MPFAAVAVQAVGGGLRLGPGEADIPLTGVAEYRATQASGAVMLEGPGGRLTVPRGRPTAVGPYTVTVGGPPGRAVLTVFGARRAEKAPEYFRYDPDLAFDVRLTPPEHPGTIRVLAPVSAYALLMVALAALSVAVGAPVAASCLVAAGIGAVLIAFVYRRELELRQLA